MKYENAPAEAYPSRWTQELKLEMHSIHKIESEYTDAVSHIDMYTVASEIEEMGKSLSDHLPETLYLRQIATSPRRSLFDRVIHPRLSHTLVQYFVPATGEVITLDISITPAASIRDDSALIGIDALRREAKYYDDETTHIFTPLSHFSSSEDTFLLHRSIVHALKDNAQNSPANEAIAHLEQQVHQNEIAIREIQNKSGRLMRQRIENLINNIQSDESPCRHRLLETIRNLTPRIPTDAVQTYSYSRSNYTLLYKTPRVKSLRGLTFLSQIHEASDWMYMNVSNDLIAHLLHVVPNAYLPQSYQHARS